MRTECLQSGPGCRRARRRPARRSSSAARGLLVLALAVVCAGFVVSSAVPPQPVAERAAQARTAYDAGDFAAAQRLYREILAGGWESAALLYNLGCASYRMGEMGWAVAYLEEARRLAPRDPEIRHNLRIVRAPLLERLPESEQSWLLGLLTQLLDAYAPADVLTAVLVLGWAAALLLAVRWVLGRRVRRGTQLGLRLLAAIAVLIASGGLLKAYQVHSAPNGAIVATEAAVLAGPRDGEAVQFTVPAGTLVHLGRRAGEWREIWLSDEMRGWVREESATELRGPHWIP